ncbi:MAG: transporter [Deltaproteobacteria bacterium HGW-Deltaproteobacteria-13]|nr:MAG: transporter [Deltaproteobacteria bacterium HGW-Deltaproteobacteria-13]
MVGLLIACPSWAAHPLITDDTGTQGKGKFQLELNGQYDWDEDDEDLTVKSTGGQASATLSYGVAENVDLVLSLPYIWGKAEVNEETVYDEKGFGDVTLETKLRLLEKNGFSLAIKPGISFPTGNEEKGLGAGLVGGHIFLIASQELGEWAFHGNFGYIRNENNVDERRDLWHASFAATWEVIKNLKLAANAGIEKNPDEDANNDPAFLVGGVIYSIKENIDVDCGVKFGLSKSETDISALAGMTFRF